MSDPSTLPVVLFLHGACLNGGMWEVAVGAFGPAYRCIVPDLPGHGTRRSGRFLLDDAVAQLEAELAGIGSLSIVGESMGGYTALALAARLGERVRCVVASGASANLKGLWLTPWLLQDAVSRGLNALMGDARFEHAVIGKLRRNAPSRVTQALVERGLRLEAFHEVVQALRGRDFRADVARIAAPILFVNGGRDTRCVWQEPGFVRAARDARTHRFPGAVHGVSLWNAHQFAPVARAFVDRHQGTRP